MQRDELMSGSRFSLWKIADTVIKVSFPFVMGACGTACGYVYSELQVHDKQLAVIEVSYQTKAEASSDQREVTRSLEGLKDLIHTVDTKLSRLIGPEGNK